jgi:hypothetical protein
MAIPESVANYDLNEVIKAFMRREFPERNDLVKFFGNAIRTEKVPNRFLSEIVTEALRSTNGQPADCMALALMYGMVIGALVEKQTKRRLVMR